MKALFLFAMLSASIPGRGASPAAIIETHRADGSLESRGHYYGGQRNGLFETFWPNGRVRSSAHYVDDVFHGEYRTWAINGQPYELRHFDRGHESGLQQSWDSAGNLYLNYEMRHGRRYGFVNAKPCVRAAADGTSDVAGGGAR